MARKVSERGRRLIADWEGRELEAYRDGGGVWTIGVGHTGPDVRKGMVIDEAECDRLFDLDLQDHCIDRFLGDCPTNQDQYDAMTSLAFNIGLERFRNSTVLKRHKMQNYVGAANAFLLWKYDNGKLIPGLLRRREAERKVYMGRA
jgi:lysozyme